MIKPTTGPLARASADEARARLIFLRAARDGLTFFYFLRQQLAAGRIPPPDDINFGAQYQISVTYLEAVDITVGGERRKADKNSR